MDKNNIYIVSIVAIVAIVALVIFFAGGSGTNLELESSEGSDLAGQAMMSLSGFCEENDGGNEKYEPGVVAYKKKITSQRSGWSKWYQTRDIFDNRKGKLKEYYCANGKLNWDYVECENGYDKVKMDYPKMVNGQVKSTYAYYCNEPEFTCEDTDGDNIYTKGVLTASLGGMNEIEEDTCVIEAVDDNPNDNEEPTSEYVNECSGDFCQVTEYLCGEDDYEFEVFDCPYGCNDGACLEEEEEFCNYLDLNGQAKPQDWKYNNFDWPYNYTGIETQDGILENYCDEDTAMLQVCQGYEYAPYVEEQYCYLGCHDNGICCKYESFESWCNGDMLFNKTTTDNCGDIVNEPFDCSEQEGYVLNQPTTCGTTPDNQTGCYEECEPNLEYVKCYEKYNTFYKYKCTEDGIGLTWEGSVNGCPEGTACQIFEGKNWGLCN